MRTKQSSTAMGIYSRSGTFTPPIAAPILAAQSVRGRSEGRLMRSVDVAAALATRSLTRSTSKPASCDAFSPLPDIRRRAADGSPEDSGVANGEGLLHDAQNLLGAVALYCDLLAAPGVLKPEHRHYAEELRIVGTRSSALVERLMLTSLVPTGHRAGRGSGSGSGDSASGIARAAAVAALRSPARPITLWRIVARCSGMLSQVAGGRSIEVSYGAAASMPVLVSDETVERVLVNLVRNAAAALERRAATEGATAGPPAARQVATDPGTVRAASDGTDDETPGAIRIGVGQLVNRVGDPRPWPFRRVRLTVEDSGCGMTQQHLDQLLEDDRPPSKGGHGIGLRVVRELVAASQGELSAMSAPGIGTRVQIEWPAIAMASWEGMESVLPQESALVPGRRIGLPPPGADPGTTRKRATLRNAGLQAKAESGPGSGRAGIVPADAETRMPC
jgi:signal transduction histidine kinase